MRWKWPENWKNGLDKYKYLLIVVLAGIVLLLPGGKGSKQKAQEEQVQPPAFDLSDLEGRMEQVLSKISGAGKVSVVLTQKESGQTIYAQDIQEDQQEQTRSTVIINRGNGVEQVIPVQRYSPTFQGALAVCPGGANPTVKLQLTQAICALTGLSTEKVSVCQGEQ